jgi:hypothetical protein
MPEKIYPIIIKAAAAETAAIFEETKGDDSAHRQAQLLYDLEKQLQGKTAAMAAEAAAIFEDTEGDDGGHRRAQMLYDLERRYRDGTATQSYTQTTVPPNPPGQ